MRERGTATSVDHICVPSGLIANDAQSAILRADHKESISATVLASSSANMAVANAQIV